MAEQLRFGEVDLDIATSKLRERMADPDSYIEIGPGNPLYDNQHIIHELGRELDASTLIIAAHDASIADKYVGDSPDILHIFTVPSEHPADVVESMKQKISEVTHSGFQRRYLKREITVGIGEETHRLIGIPMMGREGWVDRHGDDCPVDQALATMYPRGYLG